MTDRSDELTERRETDSSQDILEETDRLLSESEAGDASSERRSHERADRQHADEHRETATEHHQPMDEPSTATGGSRFRPSRSLGEYFSPKAFFALALLVSAGLLAGQTLSPIGSIGRIGGMFAIAFFVGLLTSKRRYLEVSAVGVSVGAVAMVLFDFTLAVVGSGRLLVAIGAAVGLVATVAGYYFGRDLRDGLVRDVN
ncbi:DUF456 domain-containing protein [Natrarchaeobius halalkaliphilus]|uniref:DUF456 domain-containing protein n=1 Tax=Natrarchaeobius halalkaliphilus TaxID=1679091 RepID=A0A3N6MCZ7_9EURY|nr:DUF456 domain-containing protein [Natrarchaeobius halalkaliphilus]RQG91646.1 DUF456 domain-containing protein [Natrarchaeobius halalkaliphilus]